MLPAMERRATARPASARAVLLGAEISTIGGDLSTIGSPVPVPPRRPRSTRAREPRRSRRRRWGAAGPAEPSGRPRPGEGEARGRASGPPPLCRSPLCIDSMLGLFRQLRTDPTRARPSRTARRGFQAFSPLKRLVSSRRELDDGGTQRSSEVISASGHLKRLVSSRPELDLIGQQRLRRSPRRLRPRPRLGTVRVRVHPMALKSRIYLV